MALAHTLKVEMDIVGLFFLPLHDTDQGSLIGLYVHTGGAKYE